MPTGIYKRTKEHNRKVSLALKGEKGYWYGKKHTKKARKKMSLAKKGVKRGPPLEETKRKISKALKNRSWEEKIGKEKAKKLIKKLSSPYEERFGKKKAKEIRKKMSLAKRGKSYEEIYGIEKAKAKKEKMSKSMTGHKVSKKTGRKITKANKKRWANPKYKKKMCIKFKKGWKNLSREEKFKRIEKLKKQGFQNGQVSVWKGKHFSKSHKQNLSKNHANNKKENNPAWKGGVTSEVLLIRHNKQTREWRKKVFERDDWTCQVCKRRGGVCLHAHHLKTFSEFPQLRFDVDNGITLCRTCHFQIHHGGKNEHKFRFEIGIRKRAVEENWRSNDVGRFPTIHPAISSKS